MIQIHDDWHSSPLALRTLALSRPFVDVKQGGSIFPGFQVSDTRPWSALSETLGMSISTGTEAFRIYLKGQDQPTTIHRDSAMSRYSAILYLDPAEQGGTMFYRPTPTGFVESVHVKAAFNRLIVFDSSLWHSRYPLEVTDASTVERGRLIQVMFFNPD